ncbi:MAG: hypothetical protein HY843_06380 [Bdellovibrio sp.]|nr:hypothetical protein [Bdellovibrio sp.]
MCIFVMVFQEEIFVYLFKAKPFQYLDTHKILLKPAKILVLSVPEYKVFVVRGFLRNGCVFVSQGALLQATQYVLEKDLKHLAQILRLKKLVFNGFFSLLSFFTLKLAPKQWVWCIFHKKRTNNLTVFSFIRFSIVLIMYKFIGFLGRPFNINPNPLKPIVKSLHFHLESLI